MCSDPGPDLCPVGIEQQEAALSTTLDQLIGLGDQLVGQQPRVGLLQMVEQGLNMLSKDSGLGVQEGSVDLDMSQTSGGLDKLGSSGGDTGGRDGCAEQPMCQQQLSVVLTNGLCRHDMCLSKRFQVLFFSVRKKNKVEENRRV